MKPVCAVSNLLRSARNVQTRSHPAIDRHLLSTLGYTSSDDDDINHQSTSDCSILQLPIQFLRESDPSNYDPTTLQRIDVSYDHDNGKPMLEDTRSPPVSVEIQSCEFRDRAFQILWEDGHISEYSETWVEEQLEEWNGSAPDRFLWSGLTEDMVRTSSTMTLSFHALLTMEGMSFAIQSLYKYGIFFVTETPTDTNGAAISALASCLGGGTDKNRTTMLHSYLSGSNAVMLPRGTDGPLRTLYGTVWSTTSSGQEHGASIADSAYGHGSLPLHTDMTYMRDPPGLQIFTMVQPAVTGGESLFADGFAVAERVRAIDPEAFDTLSSTVRNYHSIDKETGWHLEASGPVISTRNNQVVGIRHNDLDRLPDLPPVYFSSRERDEFYDKLKAAHRVWDQVLADDDRRLQISLRKGETMVVANQRCFHGRKSFTTSPGNPRVVSGCYVSQDELNSRFRMQGYNVY